MSEYAKQVSRSLPPEIGPGLDRLPLQIFGFPEYRGAMLSAVRAKAALAQWRARGKDDLGVMFLEMWAYICDLLSFYDEVIANENYLRTAQLETSIHKLIELLGYLPRPAVATSATLAAIAEGRKPVLVPAGIAFSSSTFDSEGPHVFELDNETLIHPLTSSWILTPTRRSTIGVGSGSFKLRKLLLNNRTVYIKTDDPVFLIIKGAKPVSDVNKKGFSPFIDVPKKSEKSFNDVFRVVDIVPYEGKDKETYAQLELDRSLELSASTQLKNIVLTTPTLQAALWTMNPFKKGKSVDPDAISTVNGKTQLILDKLYHPFIAGDYLLLRRKEEYRWARIERVQQKQMHVSEKQTILVPGPHGSDASAEVPAIKSAATCLLLDADINSEERNKSGDKWTKNHAAEISVLYSFISAGEVTVEADMALTPKSNFMIASSVVNPLEKPSEDTNPTRFSLQDVNETAYEVGGFINFDTGKLSITTEETWDTPLVPPVTVYGNLLSVSRGESAEGEVLGSGDTSQVWQSFTLKKKPLTYLSSPTGDNSSGIASTLKIWVDGVLWHEVRSLFYAGSDDPVYMVRHNSKQESVVTFGNGLNGRRLPTGVDNIIASYRFGAGSKTPPAGTISQLEKSVKGLISVHNPQAAFGGGDAESASEIRQYAPHSALSFGRAISLEDFEAIANGLPGVSLARAEWEWHASRQRPVVLLSYIGDSKAKESISRTLRNRADPSLPIEVTVAQAQSLRLGFHVNFDPRYIREDVLRSIHHRLVNLGSGALIPENLGISQPLYRSKLYQLVLDEPGVTAVDKLLQNGQPFTQLAIRPKPGCFFDVINTGELILNDRDFEYG